MEPTDPTPSKMIFSTPPDSPPVGLLVDLASPTATSEDTFAPLEDPPDPPFMTPLSNTPSPPLISPLPVSLKYSEVEKRQSDGPRGRPRTWYGGSENIASATDEELRRSNSLEDFAKALASVSDDESLASATSEANSKEGLLNTMCSMMEKEARSASFVSSISDLSAGKESDVESDIDSQHGDECRPELTQEDIKEETVRNVDEYQRMQGYTQGESNECRGTADNLDCDEVKVSGDAEVHLENEVNGEIGMHGVVEGRSDAYNENGKVCTSESLGEGLTMKTVDEITAGGNVEKNEDENGCENIAHERMDSEHESANLKREHGDMEHEFGETAKVNYSHTELECENTEHKDGDTEPESKDTQEEYKDTQEDYKDTQEEYKDTQEEYKDTQEESNDMQEESKDMQEKSKDMQEESKDTQEESKDTQEESKDTQEESKDTQEESKDTQEESKDTQEESKDTQEESKDTQEESKDIQEESKDMQKEYKDTEPESEDTEIVCRNTEHESEDTEEESNDTEHECEDLGQECKNTEENAKNTEDNSKETQKKSKNTVRFLDKSEEIERQDKDMLCGAENTAEPCQTMLIEQENTDYVDPEDEPMSNIEAIVNHDNEELTSSREVEDEDFPNLENKLHENVHNGEQTNNSDTIVVCNEVSGDADESKDMAEDTYKGGKDERNENEGNEQKEELIASEQLYCNENFKEELSNDNEESTLSEEEQFKKPGDDAVLEIGIPEEHFQAVENSKDGSVENLSEKIDLLKVADDSEENRNDEVSNDRSERNEMSPEENEAGTKESNESINPEEEDPNLSTKSGNVAEELEESPKVSQDRGEHCEDYPTEAGVRLNDPDIGADNVEENSNEFQPKIKYEDLNDIECEVIDFCLPGQKPERSAELFRVQATHDVESGDDSDHDRHIHFDEKARSVMPSAEERSPTNLDETFSGMAFRQRSAVLLGVKTPVSRSGSDVSVTSLQDVQLNIHANHGDGDISPGVLNNSRKAKSFGDLSTLSDSRAEMRKDDGDDSEDERKRIQEDHSVRLHFNIEIIVSIFERKFA